MKFKTNPYAHQKTAFEKFKDSPYFALFADMGTGKSKIAIDICAYNFLEKRINACLLIAPNNVHSQWIKEQFPIHCVVPYKAFVWNASKTGQHYNDALRDFLVLQTTALKVFAVNVEAFQYDGIIQYIAEFVKNHTTFIIVDEATRIKHNTAKRSKTIHRLNKYGIRCILTGTPTAKSPFNLWSMFEFLKANYFDCNYFIFQHRFGILVRGQNPQGARYNALIDEKTYNIVRSKLATMKKERGTLGLMPNDYETIAAIIGTSEKNVYFIESHDKYTQYKRLDELKEYISKDVFSIRKNDCLDLPPKIYEQLIVDMSEDQARVYKNLKQELFAQYDGIDLTVANKVALTTRLMQISGGFFPYSKEGIKIVGSERFDITVSDTKPIGATNPKIEALKEDIEDTSEDTKIIVWAHFVAELKMIYAELKHDYSCCLYYGGTSQKERGEIITDFQNGKYRIFIGNAATAGFGLNLQIATLQYFFSNTFNTEDRLQAEDRSHRLGVKSAVVYKDIIAKNTIDDSIWKNISIGRNLNDYFKSASLKQILNGEDQDD